MATRIRKRCINLFFNNFNLCFDTKLSIIIVMVLIINYEYITIKLND